jgi:hypothetical protein
LRRPRRALHGRWWSSSSRLEGNGGGGAHARTRAAAVGLTREACAPSHRGRPRRARRAGPRTKLPRAHPWSAEPACDNPPRKIPYYHLITDPLWLLSNSKVSSCH